MYLTYPPLLGINLDDFHNETFIATFMLYAIYFSLDKKWKKATPFVVLTLLVIEESGLLVAAFLVFLFVYHKGWKDRGLGFLLGIAALVSVGLHDNSVEPPCILRSGPERVHEDPQR